MFFNLVVIVRWLMVGLVCNLVVLGKVMGFRIKFLIWVFLIKIFFLLLKGGGKRLLLEG